MLICIFAAISVGDIIFDRWYRSVRANSGHHIGIKHVAPAKISEINAPINIYPFFISIISP